MDRRLGWIPPLIFSSRFPHEDRVWESFVQFWHLSKSSNTRIDPRHLRRVLERFEDYSSGFSSGGAGRRWGGMTGIGAGPFYK